MAKPGWDKVWAVGVVRARGGCGHALAAFFILSYHLANASQVWVVARPGVGWGVGGGGGEGAGGCGHALASKGCQCVPTPPRALTTPTAHTPSGPRFLATREYLKAANACPHPPALSPPPPPAPHTPSHPGVATTHTWLAFPRCLESI